MKVAGFTFIRNAVKLDFPIVESIKSVLPICDRFYVAVGDSDDGTRDLIASIDPVKIVITDTVWDHSLQRGGVVYARETDKAFDSVPVDFDWCFYIQGDEVVHEKYLKNIQSAMAEYLDNKEVDGLLFRFRHFYGTYDFTGDSRKWYRNEIRIIRNDKLIRSYRDAQGFRKDGRKLPVKPVDAEIYHYGWVRHPRYMQQKIDAVRKYYSGMSAEEARQKAQSEEFNYSGKYDALAKFEGTHPQVMQERIARLNWKVDVDTSRTNMIFRYKLLYKIEKIFGVRLFEYRNYRILQ